MVRPLSLALQLTFVVFLAEPCKDLRPGKESDVKSCKTSTPTTRFESSPGSSRSTLD